jgi:CcmD family protein
MSMILSTYNLLAAAYIIVWLAIFLYVARLHAEQRRLARGMEKLQSRLGNANDNSAEN